MGKYTVDERLTKLVAYEPVTGSYPVRLDANESFIKPDEDTQRKIADEISAASLNRYPDPYASDVCKAFSDYCGVPPENIVAGNGSDELISIIMSSFFLKRDKIAIFSPDFSMYRFYADLNMLDMVIIEKDEDMNIDMDGACERINKEGIKGVILSNPCNPTSIGMSGDNVLKLAKRTDALVIIDEAYMDFYGQSVASKIFECDNLIVLKTCSKALALAGIRLGFALSDKVKTDVIKSVKSPYNVSLLTQLTAKVLLSDIGKIKRDTDAIIKSRDYLHERLCAMQGGRILRVFDSVTNFVFMKVKDGDIIYDGLLQNGIVVRLLGDYLRVSAGSADENEAFLTQLSRLR